MNIYQEESRLQVSKNWSKQVKLSPEIGEALSNDLYKAIFKTPNLLRVFLKYAPLIKNYWKYYKKIIKDFEKVILLSNIQHPFTKEIERSIDIFSEVMLRLDTIDYNSPNLVNNFWPGSFQKNLLQSDQSKIYWGIKKITNVLGVYLIEPGRFIQHDKNIFVIICAEGEPKFQLQELMEQNKDSYTFFIIDAYPLAKKISHSRRIKASEFKFIEKNSKNTIDSTLSLFEEIFTGPTKKTIDYLRRRIRRNLIRIKKDNPKLYAKFLLTYLFKIKKTSKVNFKKQLLLSEFLFGADHVKAKRNGRGNLSLPKIFEEKGIYTQNLENLLFDSQEIINFLASKKSTNIHILVFIFRIIIAQSIDLDLRDIDKEKINHLLESQCEDIVNHIFSDLAEHKEYINDLDPTSIARGFIFLNNKKLKSQFIEVIKNSNSINKYWVDRFTYAYDDAIFSSESLEDLELFMSFKWPGKKIQRGILPKSYYPSKESKRLMGIKNHRRLINSERRHADRVINDEIFGQVLPVNSNLSDEIPF
jgi:hypothetical protein